MRYALVCLLLSSVALADSRPPLTVSDFDTAELTALVQPVAHRKAKRKKTPEYSCTSRGGSCWGGSYGSDCCSGRCSANIPLLWGYCY